MEHEYEVVIKSESICQELHNKRYNKNKWHLSPGNKLFREDLRLDETF